FPENFKSIRPSVMTDEWLPRTDKFVSAISEMLGEVAN
ncbi:MAG: hypothetical protein UV55_C0023G0015, partial [Candidatus Gottesmanbacteria bacterium GW2011_GWC1_43_10]